jgi:N-acetylneuraminic acid mutarotase
MYQINKTVKQLFIVVSIISIGTLSALLSSCGGSSPTPTVTKPGNWTSIADFGGSARSGAASFVIDGKAYVGGGSSDAGTRLQDWWQYDPASNWKKMTDFTGPARSGAVAFTIGGKGYVGTGNDVTNTRLKDFYEFDPKGNGGDGSWKKIKDFVLERSGCIAFTLNDRGFVGGGSTIVDVYSDLWEYKPATDTWESKGGFSKKRTNASVIVVGNLAYLVGGIGGGTYIKEVEQYNSTTNTWTQKLTLNQKDETGNKIDQPIPRELASSFTIGEFGYLVAGSQNANTFPDCWQYNPATDRWIQYYTYNNQYGGPSREAGVGFAIGNFGYLTTGRITSNNTRVYNTVKFDPIGVPPTN